MKTKAQLALLILLIGLLAAGCGTSQTANPVAPFAGSWAGDMEFSDAPGQKESIVVTIPDNCAPGAVCGELVNMGVVCTWELTLEEVRGDVLYYNFSRVLSEGDICPSGVGTRGTLTRKADGTLFREHQTPEFIASGSLTKR